MTETFTVETPAFAGPFRTLAELILEHKIDVCDVPVASVTERFVAAARETGSWSLEEATWFLSVCALLLEMKVAREENVFPIVPAGAALKDMILA